jgi:putative salt-induced outer membrane protein YdiY
MTLGCRLAALILLAVEACGARADEVVLRNGDRLRGEIAALAGGKLVLRTDYAGEVALRWSEVASLSTTRPVEVMLEGARAPLRGILQPVYGGRALLVGADGAAVEVALGEIAFLNPKPYESGLGTHYAGHLALAAAYTRGNSTDEQFNADGELTARAREYRYTLSARLDRRDQSGAEANTAWLGSANYDRFVAERRFVYARGSLEHDRAKDVDRRSTIGAGYGAQLLDTPGASLSVRAGLDYVVVERFVTPGESYPAFGWGVKAEYTPFFHEHEGFWNLEDTAAVLIRSKTGLRIPLLQRVSASVQLNVDWERRPAQGRKATDSTLLFGVNYAW